MRYEGRLEWINRVGNDTLGFRLNCTRIERSCQRESNDWTRRSGKPIHGIQLAINKKTKGMTPTMRSVVGITG